MKTFYIVFILLSAIVFRTRARGSFCPPANMGFEGGNFNGWQCDTGRFDQHNTIVLSASAPLFDRQTLYNGSGANGLAQRDTFGDFPTLCPYGGKYSIRLGNQEGGAEAERVSYTFTVPAGASQYDLVFYYAAVLQNPGHLAIQQPRFTANTFDVTDNTYIPCSSFDYIAGPDLPGFKLSPLSITDSDRYPKVYYSDWSPVTIHLNGYEGKQMRIEFTTNDCALGQHFGYAYLDVNENCELPISGNSYCGDQKTLTLTAPGGFLGYEWYNADLSQPLQNGQIFSVSPPPPDGTRYGLVVYPLVGGLGCADTLYTTVHKNDAGFVFKVADTVYGCAATGADITAAAVTTGSSNNIQLSYFTDVNGLNYLYKPQRITTNGTYYIKAVSAEGCINILPVTVVITAPVINVTEPAPAVYPQMIDITATFPHEANTTYKYFSDSLLTSALSDPQHIAHSGIFYIQAINATGCTAVATVTVTVGPPASPFIKAVNTFTPNNDGINDHFLLTITGYAQFRSLKIYNRYGTLVFETLSPDAPWDGTSNGRPLPGGTYYWVFEGKNTYYNTNIVESGFIALIR